MLSLMANACKPRSGERLRKEDWAFKVSLAIMLKARLGCMRTCLKQPTTTTTKKPQSCKTKVNHKPFHTYSCLTHTLYEVCSQATVAGNYLFTVVSDNTPHELVSLVKLIADLIVSKSEGDKGKSEGSYNDSLRNFQ